MKKLLDKVGRKKAGGPSLVGKQIVIGSTCVRVESLLGEGGFGSIYRVREIYSGQLYAVKHLRLQGDQEAIQSVQQEARIMFKLKEHKHILRLHAVAFGGEKGAETDGYMLLDYCPNTLISMLESYNFILENSLIMDVFVSVCEAVAHMHSLPQPLAHRDLKVENVLRRTDGTWVVCDFGSATNRAQVYQTAAEIAAEEEVIRRTTTPAYRAPEMVDMLNRQRIDTKVDIWALGVMLYVLCFGKLPFQGDSKLQILYGKYDIPAGRPPVFRELIQDMLTVKPADRPDIHTMLAKARLFAPSLNPTGPLQQHQPHPTAAPQVAPSQQVAPSPHQLRQHSVQQRQPELVVVPSQNPPPEFQVSAPLIQQPRHHPGQQVPFAQAQSPRVQQQQQQQQHSFTSSASTLLTALQPQPLHTQYQQQQLHTQYQQQQQQQQQLHTQPQQQQQQQQQQGVRYQTLGQPRQTHLSVSASPSRQSTGERAQMQLPLSQESRSLATLHTELPSSNGNASVIQDHSSSVTPLSKHSVVATSSSSSGGESPRESDSPGLQSMRPSTASSRTSVTASSGAGFGAAGSGFGAADNATAGCGGSGVVGNRVACPEPGQRRLTGGITPAAVGSRGGSHAGEDWADFSNPVSKVSPAPARKDVAGVSGSEMAMGGSRPEAAPISSHATPEPVGRTVSRSPSPHHVTSLPNGVIDSINTLRDNLAGDIDAIRRQLKEVVMSNQSLSARVKALEDTNGQQRQVIERLQDELDTLRNGSSNNGQTGGLTQAQGHSRHSGFSQNDYSNTHHGQAGVNYREGQQSLSAQQQDTRSGGSFWSGKYKGLMQ